MGAYTEGASLRRTSASCFSLGDRQKEQTNAARGGSDAPILLTLLRLFQATEIFDLLFAGVAVAERAKYMLQLRLWHLQCSAELRDLVQPCLLSLIFYCTRNQSCWHDR